MPVKVSVNNLTVVHAGSNGVTIAFPDVCKTPAPPAPPIPIPYPNIAKSSDSAATAKKVTCDGQPACVKTSNFMLSTGDEAGSLMGVASNKVKGKAEFVNYSFDVFFEGKNVPRALDPMLHNDKNTPPAPLIQPPMPPVMPGPDDECDRCSAKPEKPRKHEQPGGDAGGGGDEGDDDGAPAKPQPAAGTKKSKKAPAKPPQKEAKVATVFWVSAEAWCSDAVLYRGTFTAPATAKKHPVSIQPQGGGASSSTEARTEYQRFSGTWRVKDVLPPKVGGKPAPEVKLDVEAGGVKSPSPLKVRFAVAAPRRDYAHEWTRFWLSVDDHKVTVGDDIKFVKGWGVEVVKLGSSVPAGTGGLLDAEFAWPGYRWMKADRGVKKFWDGAAWKRLPRRFRLLDSNRMCTGIYKKGADYVSQDGGKWPEPLTPWDINAADKQRRLRAWVDNIVSTWTGKFDLKRHGCISSKKACCRYPVAIKAAFMEQADLHADCIVVALGNIRSNSGLFFIGDDDIEMAAHEVGHHLGNPDEYKDADVDTSLNGDGARRGIDDNSVMGANMTTVKKRHFRTVAAVFGDVIETQYGRRHTYEPVKP